ncbi:MAG: hypothetical protein RL662_1107 [Bacteroidota bacterium]|jgi:hypothetical protein
MPKIYPLSKAGSRLLYKIRHHRGHGIHSPFVFNFVTKVIEEKTSYYAYVDISNYLEQCAIANYAETKTNRLAFKVVNYFQVKHILELGAGVGFTTLYLTVASSDTKCWAVELDPEKRAKASQMYQDWERDVTLFSDPFPKVDTTLDCIYINLKNYQPDLSLLTVYLLSLVEQESFIVIEGIRLNKANILFWKNLIKHDDVTVSLDLYHHGILFFDKKYFKRNYKLSF